jgi:hypothetical protein
LFYLRSPNWSVSDTVSWSQLPDWSKFVIFKGFPPMFEDCFYAELAGKYPRMHSVHCAIAKFYRLFDVPEGTEAGLGAPGPRSLRHKESIKEAKKAHRSEPHTG